MKTSAPYAAEDTKAWLLGMDCRLGGVGHNPAVQSTNLQPDMVRFAPQPRPRATMDKVTKTMEHTLLAAVGGDAGASNVGIDVETIDNPCFSSSTFLERNYTAQERDECGVAARSYAGLWAGKEAVVKLLGNSGAKLKSAGASLQDIELKRAEDGTVSVNLHAYAAEEAARLGIGRVNISLSYTDTLALAAAVLPIA